VPQPAGQSCVAGHRGRLLVDAGLSPLTIDFRIQLGHEAVHVRTLGLQRAPDVDIVTRARADSRIVLTFDLDFGDVLALGVLDKPSVIIFRLADERPASVRTDVEVRDVQLGAMEFGVR